MVVSFKSHLQIPLFGAVLPLAKGILTFTTQCIITACKQIFLSPDSFLQYSIDFTFTKLHILMQISTRNFRLCLKNNISGFSFFLQVSISLVATDEVNVGNVGFDEISF